MSDRDESGDPVADGGEHFDVAIDMSPLVSGTTGVSRFALALARELEAAGVLLRKFALGRGVAAAPPGIRHIRIPLRVLRPLWRATGFPKAETIAGGGRLHHAVDLEPLPSRLPVVVTVHDLGALERPDLHSRYHTALVRHHLVAARRADAVLVVSRVVGDEVIAAGCDPETVVLTPPGVTRLAPTAAPPPVDGPYVLAVGWVAKRKGVDVLVRAMQGASIDGVRVVVAGADSSGSVEVKELIRELGLLDRVQLLGAVSDETLSALYQGAVALVHPSRFEGFGSPVVEALARGLPVVATDLPALREVGGDAVLFVPPGDPEALAGGLERIVTDATLRATLAARGPARAEGYTWARTAETTIQGYRVALEHAAGRRRR